MTTETMPETVDVTPKFNYSREVEVAKRFVEKVLTLAGEGHLGSEVLEFVRNSLVQDEIRRSMGLVMANDIERQIRIDKNFPLQRQVWFHEFIAYSPEDANFLPNRVPCSECDGLADSVLHLFA